MITDTAYLRNPNYHTRRDTIETLDFERMARVIDENWTNPYACHADMTIRAIKTLASARLTRRYAGNGRVERFRSNSAILHTTPSGCDNWIPPRTGLNMSSMLLGPRRRARKPSFP